MHEKAPAVSEGFLSLPFALSHKGYKLRIYTDVQITDGLFVGGLDVHVVEHERPDVSLFFDGF
jgi:hypothetical protein